MSTITEFYHSAYFPFVTGYLGIALVTFVWFRIAAAKGIEVDHNGDIVKPLNDK